jgi:hypothetical protein
MKNICNFPPVGKPRIIRITVLFFCILIFVFLLISLSFPPIQSILNSPRTATLTLIAQLDIALKSYLTEYGELPASSKNSRLLPILRGQNPRHIVLMEFNAYSISSNREILDGWGTPLRFEFQFPDRYKILSAGADTSFQTDDDLAHP